MTTCDNSKRMLRLLTLLVAICSVHFTRPALAADFFAGRDVYALHCQTCHGENGRATEPGTPDFSRGDALFTQDRELLNKIRDGAGAMPAYRGLLKDDEIRDVIAYLRSLQK